MKKVDPGLHYPIDLESLPKTWDVDYLGKYSIEIQPGFASGAHNQEGQGIPHLRPMNINRNGKIDLSIVKYVPPDKDGKRLKAGDVLFNNTNSPELVGKTTTIAGDNNWGFSNHMTRINFPEEISPKFVAYQFNYLWMRGYFLHRCLKHVNQASISSKTLANSVPLIIAPRDEQARIVAEIEKQFSRLDEAVAALKRIMASLKRYKASVLKAAVEGKLTKEWREQHLDVEPASELLRRILTERRKKWKEANAGKKYREPAKPDIANLPGLPNKWNWATFEQVSNRVTVGHVGPMKNEYIRTGIPFLRSQNVRQNKYDPEGLKFISSTFHRKLQKSALQPGDIVVVRSGSVGVSCVVPHTLPAANCSDLIIVKQPMAIIPEYGAYYMNSITNTHVAAKKVGVALTHFNTKSMATMPVSVPPIIEQKRIVTEVESRLSVVDEVSKETDMNIKRAERLRQSVLNQAFSGKLR